MGMVDNSFMCTAVVSQSAWWLNRIEAILNDLSGKQWNSNNGKSSWTPKRKKGVVSLEKDMKENHILLEGNDPFFTFGQFKTLMCTGNIPSWETIEIGIKNWMSGEVTFDQCDSKCVVVKSELKRFYRNVNRTRNAQTQKGAVSRGLDMKQIIFSLWCTVCPI